MALKNILSLVDDTLKSVYETLGYSADKDRDRFVKKLDKTKSKFLATEPARGAKDYSVKNNTVRYTPTLNGKPLAIGEKTVMYIPAERFADFIDKLRIEVEQGGLDDELKAAAEGSSADKTNSREDIRTAKMATAKRTAGTDGSGWSPERRAKFAETVAKRNAAKKQDEEG